jgi:hypothetical protein
MQLDLRLQLLWTIRFAPIHCTVDESIDAAISPSPTARSVPPLPSSTLSRQRYLAPCAASVKITPTPAPIRVFDTLNPPQRLTGPVVAREDFR